MKQLIIKSLVTAFAVLLSLNVYAYDAYIGGIYYDLDTSKKEATVTSGDNTYTGTVIIPTSVNNEGVIYNVTSIGDEAFLNCRDLTSVTIPSSVTSIGNSAFMECYSLSSIIIPEAVTSIGSRAFLDCWELNDVTIPNSVTYIGQEAFDYSSWYNNKEDGLVYVGKIAYAYKGTMPEQTSIVIKEGTVTISPAAFYGCSGLTSVTIPNSITSIGDYAFSGCSGLTSVNIPNSVTSIGNYAFWQCSSLNSIQIPNSIISIGDYAFSECSSLTSANIPNSVTSIGNSVFSQCSSLTSVTIPNSVTSIGGGAFSCCSGLTSVIIPNSVTSIGGDAFGNCSGLASITIPNSVTSIEGYAFQYCSGLTSVTIPNSVTSIGENAFVDTPWYNNKEDGLVYAGKIAYAYKGTMPEQTSIVIEEGTVAITPWVFNGCSRLVAVTIPNSVTSIGDYAFAGCSSITSITIPNSVTLIGSSAFENCSGLTAVVSDIEKPFTFGSYAFANIASDCTITVPYGTKDAYIAAGWTEDVFKGGIIEMLDQQSVTIGSAGIATFCSTKNLDFSGTDDVKAYIVSTFTPSSGEVTLTRVRDVPANTGLVLIGTEGTYDIPVGTGETVMANMLVGVTSDTQLNKVDGDYTNYILAKKESETGFFAVKDGSMLGAGKAYLPLPTALLPGSSSAKVRFVFEDGTATGVEAIAEHATVKTDGIYYNLQGQRVERPQHGLYIVNGKKVWMK